MLLDFVTVAHICLFLFSFLGCSIDCYVFDMCICYSNPHYVRICTYEDTFNDFALLSALYSHSCSCKAKLFLITKHFYSFNAAHCDLVEQFLSQMFCFSAFFSSDLTLTLKTQRVFLQIVPLLVIQLQPLIMDVPPQPPCI